MATSVCASKRRHWPRAQGRGVDGAGPWAPRPDGRWAMSDGDQGRMGRWALR